MTNKQIESKINELQNEIDKLKKQAEKNSKKSKVWRPKNGERYSYLGSNGNIICDDVFYNDEIDNYRISIGNCFPNTPEGEKEAEEYRGKLIARATVERWIKENDDVELDWSDNKQEKFFLYYHPFYGEFGIKCNLEIQYSEYNVSSLALAKRMLVELEKEFKIYYNIK